MAISMVAAHMEMAISLPLLDKIGYLADMTILIGCLYQNDHIVA
jgi:hypothetical protein